MIKTGQKTTYLTADMVSYKCKSNYIQQNVRDIICICDVANTDEWSCSIADLENECEKG